MEVESKDKVSILNAKNIFSIKGHTQNVNCVIQADNLLVSGSNDRTIKVWIFSDEKFLCKNTFEEHKCGVRCLLYLKSRHYLISSDSSGFIIIWDLNNFSKIHAIQSSHQATASLVEINDHSWASGSWDKTIKIWDSMTFECSAILETESGVWSLVVSPDGLLVAGYESGSIVIWNPSNSESICEYSYHFKEISSLTLWNNSILVSGSHDKHIKFWNLNLSDTSESLKDIYEHDSFIRCLCLTPSQNYILSGSDDHTIRICNPISGECIKTLDTKIYVFSICFFNQYLIVAGGSSDIQVWA